MSSNPSSRPDAEPPGARRGRPRHPRVDERLDAAVLALLRAGGPAAVTVEAVAAEADVAKTTIYRRHANRAELLTAALANAVDRPDDLPEGTVREKIRAVLEKAWHQMTDVLGPGGLAAILADTDPEFTALFRSALRPFDDALVARIRDDAAAGELRPDVDADGVVSLLIGAYLGELLRHGRIDDDWLDRSLEMIWVLMAGSDR